MAVRVAINGFGRIGRLVLRAAYEQGRRDITFVAVNDLGSVEANAHLLRHDSIHGPFPGTIRSGKTWIDLDNNILNIIRSKTSKGHGISRIFCLKFLGFVVSRASCQRRAYRRTAS